MLGASDKHTRRCQGRDLPSATRVSPRAPPGPDLRSPPRPSRPPPPALPKGQRIRPEPNFPLTFTGRSGTPSTPLHHPARPARSSCLPPGHPLSPRPLPRPCPGPAAPAWGRGSQFPPPGGGGPTAAGTAPLRRSAARAAAPRSGAMRNRGTAAPAGRRGGRAAGGGFLAPQRRWGRRGGGEAGGRGG